MDERDVFVDRPLAIALFELLYLRDEAEYRPLPIVVVYGPGGAGRTRLLDYLYSRGKDPLTCALVRARPSGGPRSLLQLLDAIQEELAADPHPQCGLIPFPRYELGKWMREISPGLGPHPAREALRAQLQRRLNLRFRAPGDAGHAGQNAIIFGVVWIVVLLLQRFLAKPSVVRRLLWGRHHSIGFAWYERTQRDIDLPKNHDIRDVIRRVCALIGSGEPEDATAIDELLLSAFLDDLRAAYHPTETRSARLRTAYCVALVDDIDLLPDGHGFRLLEMLAERRAAAQHQDPLLLVATTQRWWGRAGAPTLRPSVVPGHEPPSGAATGPAVIAETTHTAWLDALHRSRSQGTYPASTLFLPLALPRLTRTETRRLLTRTRPRGRPETGDILAEEVFQATHGHPQAVHLVKHALASRRPGAPRLGIRRIMTEPPEPPQGGIPGLASGESIDESLLGSFLEPTTGRLGQQVLAACALPRTLDVATLHALLGLPGDDSGQLRAREVWDELASYAFTEAAGDGRLVFHPLLRDLLIRASAGVDEGPPLSYSSVHARLAGHFAALADEHPDAVVDCVYHELANGRSHAALGRLRHRLRPDNPARHEELLAVARAPSPPDTPWYRSFRTRARGNDPLVALLDQARDLYSPTSETAWTVDLLEDMGEALQQVDGAASGRPGDLVRLTRPFEPARDEAQWDDNTRPFVRTDEDVPFPCPYRALHRTLWRAAAVVVLLAPLLAYLGAYRAYAVATCDPAGPRHVWTVVTDRVVDDGMHVRHAGPAGRGPCVGITDGDDFVYGEASTARIQRRIADQNEQVLQIAAQTGRPYVTAVVMTPLTSSGPDTTEEVAAGRSELEGVYLAQRQHNQAGYVPMLRVLVANPGDNAEHAVDVAHQIVHAADQRDSTIVAVLGLGHGTGTTLRAAQIFGAAGLPVIASAASSDAFRDAADRFFRVAAPNHRQAAVAAAYAKGVLKATTAVVVLDPTDEYSKNLAEDFVASFADGKHRMVWPGTLTYDASRPEVTNVLSARVSSACLQQPDLIFYAGRAAEMDTVLGAMADAPCDPSIAIMGGHDLSLLGVPPLPQPVPEIRNPVYYTAAATPAAWRPGQAAPFFRDHRAYLVDVGLASTDEAAFPNARAALAYDATSVLTGAAAQAPEPADVDKFVVWRRIRLTTGPLELAGAGGVIDFGSDPNGDPRDKAVMLMRLEEYGSARWIGACGHIAVNPEAVATPPERIPCPED